MATANPFDLLGDDDNDDPSQLLASAQLQLQLHQQQQKAAAAAASAAGSKKGAPGSPGSQEPKPIKLPTKPLPPAQAVWEAKNESGRGGRGVGRGGGRGRGGGFNRDNFNNDNAFSMTGIPISQGAPAEEGGKPYERRPFTGPRGPYPGGRRGSFNGEEGRDGEYPRRVYERRSGTGHGNEFKREGAGRGNWGTQTDQIAPAAEEEADQNEKNFIMEKPAGKEDAVDVNQDTQETEEKEPEEKEMTLEEYQKLLEEKRKALQALKTEERKVVLDKEFESMQQLSSKKGNDTIFIKLAADKDKRKEISDKDDKTKKSLSINEFLKPVAGERYNPGGRGRGHGRGSRGGFGGSSHSSSTAAALAIEDHGQFPTLGGK